MTFEKKNHKANKEDTIQDNTALVQTSNTWTVKLFLCVVKALNRLYGFEQMAICVCKLSKRYGANDNSALGDDTMTCTLAAMP